MQMFIPPLGTKIRLLEDIYVSLMAEIRNRKLWDLHHSPPTVEEIPYRHRRFNVQLTPLFIDDTYIIDRIYIRNGAEGYDSVTLRGQHKVRGVYHNVRFWIPLHDFNKLNVEVIDD